MSGIYQCFSKLGSMNLCIVHGCIIMEGLCVIFFFYIFVKTVLKLINVILFWIIFVIT